MGYLQNKLMEVLLEKRRDDVIRCAEAVSPRIRKEKKAKNLLNWYKKNTNLQNSLTSEQLQSVKETWKDIWDTGVVNPDWTAIYTEKTGTFLPEYVGSDLHYYYVEYNMIDFDYIRAFCDKNYMDIILPYIRYPETLIRKIRGMYLNKAFEKITFENAVDMIYAEREKGLVVKISRESSGGAGVTFVDEHCTRHEIEELLQSGRNLNIQYVIKQHPAMAKMNASSINTIRIMTMIIDGEVIPLSACVRIGSAGSKVDNLGTGGGVSCGVNEDGSLKGCGYTYQGDRVEVHANGFNLKEGKVPNYKNVLEIVKRLHYCVPVFGIISWDIAIDETGEPVLIEYNVAGGNIDLHQYNNGPLYGEYREKIIEDVFKNYQVRGATLDYNYSLKGKEAFITKGGNCKKLIVPVIIDNKKVTRIYDHAFENSFNLQKVVIKADLERIGYVSFYGCKNLKKVIFKGSVKEIARSAFNGCEILENIRIPEGCISIGRMAFRNCSALQQVTIPLSVETIAKDAFIGAEKVVIHCSKGSYAEKFAIEQGIRYKNK